MVLKINYFSDDGLKSDKYLHKAAADTGLKVQINSLSKCWSLVTYLCILNWGIKKKKIL